MTIKTKKTGPEDGRIAGERRTGINRRILFYDCYIPERRATTERRKDLEYPRSKHEQWNDRTQYA